MSATPSQLGHAHITIQMISDPTYLAGAREFVASVARRLGFTEEGSGQIALAVDEALCNVIRHGYERRKDGPIWLHLWPLPADNGSGPGVRLVIEDEARQVDPSMIKSRDLDEIRPGGLGVHIIKQVMDEVRYEKRERTGMRLTLVKRQSGQAAPAGSCGAPRCG